MNAFLYFRHQTDKRPGKIHQTGPICKRGKTTIVCVRELDNEDVFSVIHGMIVLAIKI